MIPFQTLVLASTLLATLSSWQPGANASVRVDSWSNFGFGEWACLVGDIDCDGVKDFAVSAPWTKWHDAEQREHVGVVYVYSGRTREKLATWRGDGEFGFRGAPLGDLDGDGFEELAVAGLRRGLTVVSARDGAHLRTFDPSDEIYGLNARRANGVTSGDVNGDGALDVVVGIGSEERSDDEPGGFAAFDANTGTLLGSALRHPFAPWARSIGDVDRDGRADVLLHSTFDLRRATGPVRMTLVSGDGTHVIREFELPFAFRSHFDACSIGDLDGDGISDFAIGCADAYYSDDSEPGTVLVYSGANGNLLRIIRPQAKRTIFGYSVAAAGDVDGDGSPDLLVGAYENLFLDHHSDECRAQRGESSSLPFDRAPLEDPCVYGEVWLVSGRTGERLSTHREHVDGPAALGTCVLALDDIDGDGIRDYLGCAVCTALPSGFMGSVYVFSGADGSNIDLLRE